MNTAEPLTEDAALWASINEMPGDKLRRLVLADWYEERGQEDTAAALRATADRVPQHPDAFLDWWSWHRCLRPTCIEPGDVYELMFDAMGRSKTGIYSLHPTAADAIRDLCRAWVKVHREGTA